VSAAGTGTGRARLLAGEAFAHIANLADDEPYRTGEPHRRALVDLGGARTALLVPLRRNDTVSGLIMIYRQEVRPFTDRQIAQMQTFAAQAVIAMENARLLGEQHESLEQQTATSEILQIISQSPTDVRPVLTAVAKAAIVRFAGTFSARLNSAHPRSLRSRSRMLASGKASGFDLCQSRPAWRLLNCQRRPNRRIESRRCVALTRDVLIVGEDRCRPAP